MTAASRWSAAKASSTRTNPHSGGSAPASGSHSTRKALTPRPYISARKTWESWFRPRIATNSGSPSQPQHRLSVTTSLTARSLPENAPPQMRAISDNRYFMVFSPF